jgi:maltose O-acetyltransferase
MKAKRILQGVSRLILRFVLKLLPLFSFPSFNTSLFRLMGYDLHKSVKTFSSLQILGDIRVTVGENTFIGHETIIMGGESAIYIGKNCDISSRVSIVSGTHKIDMKNVRSAGEGTGKDIIIEDGVWIGFGAIILPGARIGFKSIIGAGTIVSKEIPPYSIAAGNPCKIIREYDPLKEIWKDDVGL